MKPDIEKLPYTNLIERQTPHLLMPPTGSQAQVEQPPNFLEFGLKLGQAIGPK